MKGTVKFFDGTKGWGFITDENKNDVFVHYSNITMEGRKSLNQNDIVEFEIGEGKDGRTQAVTGCGMFPLIHCVTDSWSIAAKAAHALA